jgi:hypothetical protein
MARELGIPHGVFRIEKRAVDDNGVVVDTPFETIEKLNSYTNVGGAIMLDLLIGAAVTNFSNSNAYLGSGDTSTAFAVGQTDLQAPTNKLRKAMDSTFPSRSGQVLTFKSTFGTSEANWIWNEIAVFNASSSGTMLCRAVANYGTKTSAAAWTLSYTLTIP